MKPQSMDQPGYYPGFRTLSQQAFWDKATRDVVLDRVENVPPLRFFNPQQARCMKAVFDRLIPQDDRSLNKQIAILNVVDARLYSGRIDGYRFAAMPPDREAYQLGVQALDGLSRDRWRKSFEELKPTEQDEVLKSIHDGKPWGPPEIWETLEVHYFWFLMLQDAIEAYYAHPFAWDEIGFGGPSYPRGYMRLENGRPEPWEVREKRYEWTAPTGSLSDCYEPVGGGPFHGGTAGTGGTH